MAHQEKLRFLLGAGWGALLVAPLLGLAAEPVPVAGLVPYERPTGAPVIKTFAVTPEWRSRATRGIAEPLPGGLGFLKDQGPWYTPFIDPGMPGYYDIRELLPRLATASPRPDYLRARYSPLHFKPAIESAGDEQCLSCHREVLDDKPRRASPAGVDAATARASYQLTETYVGEQDSFHRRHLVTAYARSVMQLKCNFCHQGHDPRETAPGASATSPAQDDDGFTLRKRVNVETTCLKCHGKMNWQLMGLPGPWAQVREVFRNNCLLCHASIRSNRHQVDYLNAAKIEELGAKSGDACYGCHGGRAWYRLSYPYPRHAWPGMETAVPDWARGRPTQSEARFLPHQ